MGNKLEIINCNCIQVEYSKRNSADPNNIKKSSDKINLSIFDNNYGENASIRVKYTNDLGKILSTYNRDISCTVHSKIKHFYLENVLKKNKIRYTKALKGDFNLASKSNLIISIGFQGAAIKAAFAFNKPIIFFSSDESYFKDFIFSDDNSQNKKILKKFRTLIFSNDDINILLSSKNKYYSNLDKIKSNSIEFLDLIGISSKIKNIISYLESL